MYILQEAITYAISKHGNQKYGDKPYFYHLNQVQFYCLKFELVRRFPYILIEAWLHDVLEDTNATQFDLENNFGHHIAKMVCAVTDEPGRNRKERKAKTYTKIAALSPEAVALKLADKIANVEYSKTNNPKLYGIYQDEYIDFYKALYSKEDNLDKMWNYLGKTI